MMATSRLNRLPAAERGITIGDFRGNKYRSTRRYCTFAFSSQPHAVSFGPRKHGCIMTKTNLPPALSKREMPAKTGPIGCMFWIASTQAAASK